MIFDTNKWIRFIKSHDIEDLLRDIKKIHELGIFTALGLNIQDFIIEEPKTVTRFEALEELENGKILTLKKNNHYKYIMRHNKLREYIYGSDEPSVYKKSDLRMYQILNQEFIIKEDTSDDG